MKNLVEKLKEIQSKISVPKTRTNEFGKYKYRSLEDIVEAAKPLLSEQGLILQMTDEITKIDNRFYVKAVVSIFDGEHNISTTGFAREPETKKGMDESQISGMASSYARKYALNGLFALDDVPDADHYDNTESAGGGKAATTKSAAKQKTTPAPTAPLPADFIPPKIDNEKTQQIIDILSDFYKSQETKTYKFNYTKLLKAIWQKYGKYPTTEQGAKKVKAEITFADCWDVVNE